MFLNTKSHIESHLESKSIKVGLNVPPGAVNLAYYSNSKVNKDDNVSISDSSISIIDHKTADKWVTKNGLASNDNSVFPLGLQYDDDDGYSGVLKIRDVTWKENIEATGTGKTETKQYLKITDTNTVPSSVSFDDGYNSGILDMVSMSTVPSKFLTSSSKISVPKTFIKTFSIPVDKPEYEFPSTMFTIDEDGYSGALNRVYGSERFAPSETNSNISYSYEATEDRIELNNANEYGNVINYGGYVEGVGGSDGTIAIASIRGNAIDDEYQDTIKKYLWLANAVEKNDNNSLYLYAEVRKRESVSQNPYDYISTNGSGVKFENGNFIYGSSGTAASGSTKYRTIGFTVTVDVNGNMYSTKIKLPDGSSEQIVGGTIYSTWVMPYSLIVTRMNEDYNTTTIDTVFRNAGDLTFIFDSIMTVVVNGDPEGSIDYYGNPTGAVYWTYSGTADNPGIADARDWGASASDLQTCFNIPAHVNMAPILSKSFNIKYKDNNGNWRDITSQSISDVDSVKTISSTILVKDLQSTDYGVREFMSEIINMDDWYLYRLFVTAIVHKVVEKNTGGIGNTKFTAKCEYMNTLSKDVDGVETQVPIEWTVNATYKGVINKSKKTYDGYAHYSGIVIKKNAIGNLNPDGRDEIIMYPNKDGYLVTNEGVSAIDDELFYVTDVFKDNYPLFYKYKLRYKIYNVDGPDDLGYYTGEDITLINSIGRKSKCKYSIIMKKYDNNIYDVYLYTDIIPSESNSLYVIYNGYDLSVNNKATIDNIRYGLREKISVVAAMDSPLDFKVVFSDSMSKINVGTSGIFKDARALKAIDYKVIAEYKGKSYESAIYSSIVINKEFAFYNELKDFRENACCISPLENGVRITPQEMIMRNDKTATSKILRAAQYRALIVTSNSNEVKAIIEPSGKSLIYGETFEDTGLENKNEIATSGYRFNKRLNVHGNYKCVDGMIYRAYGVKCRNVRKISVSSPRNSHALEDWYPSIKFGHFSKVYKQLGVENKLIYSIPEFNYQNYGIYGKPYVDIKKERANRIGENLLKIRFSPMYIKVGESGNILNLNVYKEVNGTIKPLTVKSFNFLEGVIEINEMIGGNDSVYCDYTYEEQYYIYRGYYQDDSQVPIKIDLNPNMYHYYTDTSTYSTTQATKQTMNLFGHTVYFFLKPTCEFERFGTGEWTKIYSNDKCLYHQIDNHIPKDVKDISIGSVFVRHNTSLKSTTIIDTRSRGGGVIEAIKDDLRRSLEPESDNYLDIGYLDGEPYNENGIIIVRLDKSILQSNGGRFTQEDVENKILKWSAYGIIPIIEYVDLIDEDDMPNNTMEVNSNIVNQISINPSIDVFYTD